MSSTRPDISKLITTKWSSSDTSNHFEVVNPATGEVITTIAGCAVDGVATAVAASQKAFTSWRWVTPSQRAQLLLKCADSLEKHREELAYLLCLENGKPYQDALQFDIGFLLGIFRYFGSVVDKLPDQFFDRGSMYCTVMREPFGVCVGILPFNWPPIHLGGKLAPCLAAGNTMIIKPGDQTPITVLRAVEIIQTVLPPDVVIALPAKGPAVPQALVSNPVVRAVSFTGSTAAGAAVARTAADTVKPTMMELGGKNAMIVFQDTDLDRAVATALEGCFFNKGEACTATSRLLVHEAIHDAFVEKLSAGIRKLVTGNGLEPNTHVGPCVNKAAQERVLKYIERGKAEGATVAAQGPLPSDPALANGCFVAPTLFTDATPDFTIAKEEIFGPVSVVIKFSSEDEAVSISNDSVYGLTAVVFTKDHERFLRIARKLDVGMIFYNQYNRAVLGTPFGGANHSGYGREHSIDTLREWTRAKAIHEPSGLHGLPNWRAVRDCLMD